MSTITDNDLVAGWDAESGTTRKLKASTIKSYAGGSSEGISKTAKYWRIRNLVKPSGSNLGSQWIVREFSLLDSNQNTLVAMAFSASSYNESAYKAADNNSNTWWDGSGQYAINQWLRYAFSEAITPTYLALWNLNLYDNIPPTLFSLDSSIDDIKWVSVFTFSITTNDFRNLLALP
ncbi:MAG: hypothetical protein V7L06_29060 [Nostoc sp.]